MFTTSPGEQWSGFLRRSSRIYFVVYILSVGKVAVMPRPVSGTFLSPLCIDYFTPIYLPFCLASLELNQNKKTPGIKNTAVQQIILGRYAMQIRRIFLHLITWLQWAHFLINAIWQKVILHQCITIFTNYSMLIWQCSWRKMRRKPYLSFVFNSQPCSGGELYKYLCK